MKRLALAAVAMSVACTASDRGGAPSATADLAITRVNVVDVESGRALPDHTVLIEGNQIVGVGQPGNVMRNARSPVGRRK